ncbi:MAG: Asp-tRNA(Asn)/Glu-tRNA(Gln) amidotransferase subunit GatA [Gammaproteobacteria bacterium]|nr:Asp-tRNA(Asn)/Glu-tRNA(Gln) amidotransferase subunit GatA [Gammaproteobacteria bacterium]
MFKQTITELSQALIRKEFSSVELTRCFLERINKLDPKLNSFITVCNESALAMAKLADEKIANGEAQTLTGIPYAHKDIFCTHGIKTTCASKMLENFIAPYDAHVTTQFNQQHMVMLGKTNMDEFAMGSSNENSYFGAVKNPWNLEHIPGGSSGGSAAAVAARLAPIATGTDTGGSIRQPAALCGLTGLKPTYGRVSRYGMIAFASSLDQGGPLALSASDAALLLNVMAGHDAKDSTSINRPVPDYTANLEQKINGLKIGLPKEYFQDGIDADVSACIQDAINTYKKLGAEFIEIELPHTNLATSAYYVIAPAECSSNLARYDGVRFGYRCENPQSLQDLYERSRSEGFGKEVKRRILIGTYVLSSGYYDAYYLQAQKVRRLIRDDFLKAFEKVDVILTPTSPSAAFKIGERSQDPVAMYLSDVFTLATNLAGLPGLSMPAGFTQNKLPVGVQLIANHFDEARLLNVAHQYQQVTDWHRAAPNLTEE